MSREKQLAQLQAEEREYQAAFQAKLAARQQQKGGTSPSSQATSSSIQQEDDDDYASDVTVPEQITDRMLRRMLMFSIGPVFLGFTLFPLFYYLKKVQDIDVPVWAVYIVQTIIFGGGLLGISYGIISSSFDQRREGSLLGWNEFKTNLPLVLDRFRKKD
jgi:Photosynthesis affected mutant 68